MTGKINCVEAFVYHLIGIPDINVYRIVCMMLINFQKRAFHVGGGGRFARQSFFFFFFLHFMISTFHSCSQEREIQ